MRPSYPIVALFVLSAGCEGSSSAPPPADASIGAILARDTAYGTVTIRDVPDGLAADAAGLLPGDQIVMIDGVYTRDLEVDAIRNQLRGPVGSTVDLTIVRADEVIYVRVERTPLGAAPLSTIQPKEQILDE